MIFIFYMQENKISIIINKPIEKVFEFTTNPKNTQLWIPSIEEEIADKYPPKINTQYKNRGKDFKWDYYKVRKFVEDVIFMLSDLDENYFVRYTYNKVNDNQTEMTYFEWMRYGELENPFTKDTLLKLKSVMESD